MYELISVVIPVYNVENFIEQCIESILHQTYSHFELILVDDGSKDSSGIICDRYAQSDTRIKVFHKENGGLSDARNTGIALASGEYLFLVDSDDFISENALEVLISFAIKRHADLVIGGYRTVNEEGNIIEEKIFEDCILVGDQISDYFFSNKGDMIQNTTAWGKLYKLSEHREDLSYPKGKLHEDEFVAHKLWLNSKITVVLSVPIYYYRKRTGSIMNSNYSIGRLDAIEAVIRRLDYVFSYEKYISEAWSMCMFILADRTVHVYSLKNIRNNELRIKLSYYQKILRKKWVEIKPYILDPSVFSEENNVLFHPKQYAIKRLIHIYFEKGKYIIIRTLKRILDQA